MNSSVETVSPTRPSDQEALQRLYADAFPDEDLWPLVRELLDLPDAVLSLVQRIANRPISHVIFTHTQDDAAAALLGPLAVAPHCQRTGLGTQLVNAGLAQLHGQGVTTVYVLGDPDYYGRFGFLPEVNVQPPCPIPDHWASAWQSIRLGPTANEPAQAGALVLPPPWMQPHLWAE